MFGRSKPGQRQPIAPVVFDGEDGRTDEPRAEAAATLRRIVLLTTLVVVLVWGSIGGWAWHTYHAARYPGATTVDASDTIRTTPNLIFRRVETYRSTDPFNVIYNWYSQRFNLGPERFAQSNCLLMARSFTVFGPLSLNASVMVCNTAADRMVFVQRTYLLRYPAWLRSLW